MGPTSSVLIKISQARYQREAGKTSTACISLGFFFIREDGGDMFFRNVL
jgi:hypothetical protein